VTGEDTTYRVLAESAIVREFQAAFRRASGLTLKLVPAQGPDTPISYGAQENAFCAQVAATPAGCAACQKTQAALRQRLGRKLTAQRLRCFAGVTDVAVPVVLGDAHVATLMGGHVIVGKPTAEDFQETATRLARLGWDGDWERLRQSYFAMPTVSDEQLTAMLRLLTIFAQQLAETLNHRMVTDGNHEPPCVTQAKAYARAHLTEHVTLTALARHVHLSPYYFCHLYKKTTRLSFLEYLNRLRIEKAIELLADPNARITEVASACGFDYLSHFDRTFKRFTGQSPKQYRATHLPPPGAAKAD
jgi:AraC-like DNA-binding protein/ligand-binding sensor protein